MLAGSLSMEEFVVDPPASSELSRLPHDASAAAATGVLLAGCSAECICVAQPFICRILISTTSSRSQLSTARSKKRRLVHLNHGMCCDTRSAEGSCACGQAQDWAAVWGSVHYPERLQTVAARQRRRSRQPVERPRLNHLSQSPPHLSQNPRARSASPSFCSDL